MHDEIKPITSLRFVAALYVFLFHIQIYWKLLPSGGLARFLVNGSCGMSLFFILSGFVLGYRFNKGIRDYLPYALSRFSRIYPAYFLAGLVLLPWLTTGLGIYDTHQSLTYVFVIVVDILMLQAWIPQLFNLPSQGGSWSLSVEMFFYVLFPSLVNRLRLLSHKQLITGLILLYLTSATPGLSWVLLNKFEHFIFYSIPIFRLSEFIIGIICGLLFARGLRVKYPSLCAISCTSQLFIYLGWGPSFGFAAIAHNYVTVPLISILIFSLASLSSGWLYRLMTMKIFMYFGRISYSFYSFQSLVLLLVITKYSVLIKLFPFMANPFAIGLLTFLSLTAIASLSYYLVETKFRAYLNNRFKMATGQPAPALQGFIKSM